MAKKLTTEEFIQRAKTVHEDRYGYEKVAYVNNYTKVTITCSEHGDFEQTPTHHLVRGQGCRNCGAIKSSISQRMSQSEFIHKAKEVHGDRYGYDKVEYVRSHSKVIITCSEHGDFEQRPTGHLKGRGCRDCGINQRALKRSIPPEEYIRLVREKFPHLDYGETKYPGMDKGNITVRCPVHGRFSTDPSYHLSSAVHGCRKCYAFSKRLKAEDLIKNFKQIHGDTYTYDLVAINRQSETPSWHQTVKIGCKQGHGYFFQTPAMHYYEKHGCPDCGYIRGSEKQRKTLEKWLEEAKEVHGDLYLYDRVDYQGDQKNIDIGCSKHGYFIQRADHHLSGHGCNSCKKKEEGKVATFLKSKGFDFVSQYPLETSDGIGRSFDFFLQDYNLLIERDGEQHYPAVHNRKNSTIFNKRGAGYEEQANVDRIKTKSAKEKGYKIARIPYWLSDPKSPVVSSSVKLEIDNILKGQPTYPDVPDPEQEKAQLRPK